MGTPVIPTWILERIARQYWHCYGTLSVTALRRAVNGYASTERIARVVRSVKASPRGGTVQGDAEATRLPAPQRGRRSPSTSRRRNAAGQRTPFDHAIAARLRILQDRPHTRRVQRTVRDDQSPIRQRDTHRAPASQPPELPCTDEHVIAAAVAPTPPPATALTNVATSGIDACMTGPPNVVAGAAAPQCHRWPVEESRPAAVLRRVMTAFVRRVHVRAMRFLSSVLRVVHPNA